jgi:integrase
VRYGKRESGDGDIVGYAEKRGDYWRARYKIRSGKYGTVTDPSGRTARFPTKRAAEQASNDEEAKVRGGRWRDPSAGQIMFGDYASRWFAVQDLAASTMQNYRRHIEEHLMPAFENSSVEGISVTDVAAWEKREREAGYAASSIKTWRATLHLILSDAVEDGLRESNPAAKRRGRGRRAGRSRHRGPEKTVTDALGTLLIAERAALLSGRDDEFVAIVLLGYTGMRWGELVGLETAYVREGKVRIERQLYELGTGQFVRCAPKDDSYRTIDLPDWLFALLTDHLARARPGPCACHGKAYVFSSHAAANGAARQDGPKLVDVARRAGVSAGTVSNVLNRPDVVTETTREKVTAVIAELGFVRGGASGQVAAHWRRSGFATWLFQPAVTGRYPKRAGQAERPVPLLADPWPGVPVRGRGASSRAEACWLPIVPGLTPHGLRHTHKTLMEVGGVASDATAGSIRRIA